MQVHSVVKDGPSDVTHRAEGGQSEPGAGVRVGDIVYQIVRHAPFNGGRTGRRQSACDVCVCVCVCVCVVIYIYLPVLSAHPLV